MAAKARELGLRALFLPQENAAEQKADGGRNPGAAGEDDGGGEQRPEAGGNHDARRKTEHAILQFARGLS